MQTIHMTVPVLIDGCLAMEFEAVADIEVTHPGSPPFFDHRSGVGDPGSGPEYIVRACYVDCGSWDLKARRWLPDLHDAPEYLVDRIHDYLATADGQSRIAEQIMEAAA